LGYSHIPPCSSGSTVVYKLAESDPAGDYVLAYDAARKSVTAALLNDGYRDLGLPGLAGPSPSM